MRKDVKSEGLEYIYNKDELYCIILRNSYSSNSISFFTPDNFSQQLGYLPHSKNNIIQPHIHKINKREVLYTHEVLIIKSGSVKINFYDNTYVFIGSEVVNTGDIILLCGGGHGFEILEETVMVEVKQGPYMGIDDKERFKGVE